MKWKIYDELLSAIPDNIYVKDTLQYKWWLVNTGDNVGISMYFEQGEALRTLPEDIRGMKLKTLAEYIKSWNFYEATVAMAAINAYYNRFEFIESMHPAFSDDVFKEYADRVAGKKVAVIGHFPLVEKLGDICHLSILEKTPSAGDYPDSACEYILEEQDYVFITGTTFANKTLPRLLELSKNAHVLLTGPSVPMTSLLFEYGVNTIAGAYAADFDRLWQSVKDGEAKGIFNSGAQMVQIESKS